MDRKGALDSHAFAKPGGRESVPSLANDKITPAAGLRWRALQSRKKRERRGWRRASIGLGQANAFSAMKQSISSETDRRDPGDQRFAQESLDVVLLGVQPCRSTMTAVSHALKHASPRGTCRVRFSPRGLAPS